MTTIWGRYLDHKPERICECPQKELAHDFNNYVLAFGAFRGQHNYRKWKLWTGRLKDEPSDKDYYGD
jgi:hypothetical protein